MLVTNIQLSLRDSIQLVIFFLNLFVKLTKLWVLLVELLSSLHLVLIQTRNEFEDDLLEVRVGPRTIERIFIRCIYVRT